MNIEIANRLVELRKKNNLSQEALAAKLGISRQAVSKWERAEASPDTDNLILLARLYGVSLDDLLKTEDEIPVSSYEEDRMGGACEGEQGFDEGASNSYSDKDEYVHVGFRGVHVKDKDGEVHVGWDGIHVDDKKKGDNVHIDKNGVYVNGERKDKEWFSHHAHFPIILIIGYTSHNALNVHDMALFAASMGQHFFRQFVAINNFCDRCIFCDIWKCSCLYRCVYNVSDNAN